MAGPQGEHELEDDWPDDGWAATGLATATGDVPAQRGARGRRLRWLAMIAVITIGAGAQAVQATVTGSTRFTGQVTGIAGVRPGAMVMAQISERNGTGVLVALQDPASLP